MKMAYKMPTMKLLPSGKWNISKQVTLHNGEKIRKSFTSTTTNKTEARKELNNQLIKWLTINDNEKKENQRKAKERIKYKDMLELYEKNKNNVEPSTKLDYITKMRAFITRNNLMDKRITTTTTKELRNLFNNEIEQGIIKSKNNLNSYKVALKSFYEFSIMQGKLEQNPIRNLDGIIKIKSTKNNELEYFTMSELESVFSELEKRLKPQFYRFYQLLLFTGMRVSELCALTIDNIDLQKGTLTISATITKGKHGYYLKKGTKTGKTRTLVMDETINEVINKQLDSIMENRGYIKSAKFREIFLFQQTDGEPYKGDNMASKFTDNMRIINKDNPEIPILTTHKLRHSYATLNLLNNPNKLMEISKRLGHESLRTTMIYINQIKDSQQSALDNSIFTELNRPRQIDTTEEFVNNSNKIDNQKNTNKKDNIVKFKKLG